MMGPGSYLAGFTFEKSGRADEALRYYDEALEFGEYESLREAVERLSRQSGYSSPRLKALLGQTVGDQGSEAAPAQGEVAPSQASSPSDNSGEILTIINFGRVPAKFAKRIPIGLALTYASGALSPGDRAAADRLALQGLVTWVNYPELGRSRGTWGTPSYALNGQWQRLEGALAVDREARATYKEARGVIIGSAITRMVSRIVAGRVAQEAAGNNAALGLLLNLGTQATLTATDTPDTRSWSTLPARITFSRVRVPPGKHKIVLTASGFEKSQTVEVKPGGWAVASLTVLN
jgi:hypothetical protein